MKISKSFSVLLLALSGLFAGPLFGASPGAGGLIHPYELEGPKQYVYHHLPKSGGPMTGLTLIWSERVGEELVYRFQNFSKKAGHLPKKLFMSVELRLDGKTQEPTTSIKRELRENILVQTRFAKGQLSGKILELPKKGKQNMGAKSTKGSAAKDSAKGRAEGKPEATPFGPANMDRATTLGLLPLYLKSILPKLKGGKGIDFDLMVPALALSSPWETIGMTARLKGHKKITLENGQSMTGDLVLIEPGFSWRILLPKKYHRFEFVYGTERERPLLFFDLGDFEGRLVKVLARPPAKRKSRPCEAKNGGKPEEAKGKGEKPEGIERPENANRPESGKKPGNAEKPENIEKPQCVPPKVPKP